MIPPTWVQALVLGVVQGLTEFLPVSSSAHLVLIPALLGWPYLGKSFDVALHFGTLLALTLYFRPEIARLVNAGRDLLVYRQIAGDPGRRLVVVLAVATIPVGLAGLLLEDLVEKAFHHPAWIGLMLIVWGWLLWLAERRGDGRRMSELGPGDAVTIGLWQAAALMPGASRSGTTMTGGLWLGLPPQEAARFSFLLSLPVVGGATLLKAGRLLREGGFDLAPTLLGTVAAGLSGWLCIGFLLQHLRRGSFAPFVYYRITLGLLVLLWWAHGSL